MQSWVLSDYFLLGSEFIPGVEQSPCTWLRISRSVNRRKAICSHSCLVPHSNKHPNKPSFSRAAKSEYPQGPQCKIQGRDQQAARAEIRGRQPPCGAWLQRAGALSSAPPWGWREGTALLSASDTLSCCATLDGLLTLSELQPFNL